MTEAELKGWIQQNGGERGRTAVGPDTRDDPEFPGMSSMRQAIPDEQRQLKIVAANGQEIVVERKGDGTYNVINLPTTKASSDEPITRTAGDGQLLEWTRGADGKSTWTEVGNKRPDSATTSKTPEELELDRAKAVEEKRERDYNAGQSKGYLTHAEVAALDRLTRQADFDAEKFKLEKAAMELANKRLDEQIKLDVKRADNESKRADNEAAREERLAAQEQRMADALKLQSDAQAAATKLAERKQAWDEKVKKGEMEAEEAWREYQQEWNEVQAKAQNARLMLDTTIAQNNADNQRRSDETARRSQDMGEAQSLRTDAREREEGALDRADASARTAVDTIRQLAVEGSRAATASLPFMAPAGTNADIDNLINALGSGQRPGPMTAKSVPFPFNPQTLVQDLVAQALQRFSPAAAQYLQGGGAAGFMPQAPAGAAPASTAASAQPAATSAPAAPAQPTPAQPEPALQPVVDPTDGLTPIVPEPWKGAPMESAEASAARNAPKQAAAKAPTVVINFTVPGGAAPASAPIGQAAAATAPPTRDDWMRPSAPVPPTRDDWNQPGGMDRPRESVPFLPLPFSAPGGGGHLQTPMAN